MSATFDPNLLVPRDRARYALGDTGVLIGPEGNPVWLLQDETLDSLIACNGYNEGLALAADGLVARYAQEPDVYLDASGVRVEWGSRLDAWVALAKRMRAQPETREQVVIGGRYESGQLRRPDTSGFRF
jgi:hypothetical protein